MKTITKKDDVSILFREWFDKTYGNTYHDATIYANLYDKEVGFQVSHCFKMPKQYGYNAGDIQSIAEALSFAGLRLRASKRSKWMAYEGVLVRVKQTLKRELNK